MYMGPNDSNIHRGDREDTGDNDARPDEIRSGPAQSTVDPTAFGGTSSIRQHYSETSDVEQEIADGGDMEVMGPSDRRLGLTNVGNIPPDDWAADTGETHTAEGEP